MLTIPDHLSRRDFFRVGALSVGGLTLADLLRLKARGAVSAQASNKAVIMVGLWGGPSHIDMYDMKPDGPAETRGKFRPIQTNVAGIRICEHLPLQARIADKFTIINGVVTPSTDHDAYQIMTGYKLFGTTLKRPAFGTVVSRFRQSATMSMPPYVTLQGTSRPEVMEDPAFLGARYRPLTSGGLDVFTLRGMNQARFADRQALMRSLDTLQSDRDTSGDLAGMDAFANQAFDIITSNRARRAFDLNEEPAQVKARYGTFTNLLQAIRLVQAGVSVVTTSLQPRSDVGLRTDLGVFGWDTHAENFRHLQLKLPQYDPAVHAMITDLYQRGLDRDVAVVFWGEFGRSPRIFDGRSGGNGVNGREHWPGASSVLVAGGGFRMGQVIGRTDRWGGRPADRGFHVQNVLATLYHHLGIDPTTSVPDNNARPVALLDRPEKIQELL